MASAHVESHHRNTLYLLAALCMIFMTMILALQPIFLRSVLGVGLEDAGKINSSIQVLTEILDLLIVGYLGYLSDRIGRVKVVVYGFIVAGLASLIIPFSLEVGLWFGVGGLAIFYLMRGFMSLGTTGVWPQLTAITGDFTSEEDRPALTANTAFMMAFGATLVYGIFMQIPRYSGLIPAMLLIPLVAFFGAWLASHYLIDAGERFDGERLPWRDVTALLKQDKRLRLTFMSAFTARYDMVLIGLFMMLWFVYFADVVGMDMKEAVSRGGILIGVIGLIILVSIPIWGWIIQRYGRMNAIVLGMAFSGAGFISMAFVFNPYDWGIYIPATLVAIGQAGTLLAPQILTIDIAPPSIRGLVLGGFNLVGGIGMIFFVEVGGLLFDWIGPYAPFVFTGVGDLFIMIYGLWVIRSSNKSLSLSGAEG